MIIRFGTASQSTAAYGTWQTEEGEPIDRPTHYRQKLGNPAFATLTALRTHITAILRRQAAADRGRQS